MINQPMTTMERVFLALLPALLLFTRVIADITVLLTALAFLWYCKKNASWQWAKSTWFKFVWLFWAYLLLVNLPLSIDSQDSLLYVISFIRWPLFMLALGLWLLTDAERQRWFLISLMLTSLFIVADTVWQYFYAVDWFGIPAPSTDRLSGPFRKMIPGTMMVRVWFIIAFAVFLLPFLQHKGRQLAWLLALMLSGLGFIFITGERMAFMLFIAGSLITITAMWWHFIEHRKQILVGCISVCILFIGVALTDTVMLERSVLSIFDKLADFYDSDYGLVFRAAYAAWQEYPIFGSGMHTYKNVCNEMGVLASISGQQMECTHPHNLYLHLMAETGLVGISLFCLMLLALYIKILKPHIEHKQWLLFALCFTVMTVSFFPLIGGISVLSNWVASIVWFGMGWCLAMSARYDSISHQSSEPVGRQF